MIEKLKLYRFAVEQAKGRVKMIAGTGNNNTADTVRARPKRLKNVESMDVCWLFPIIINHPKPDYIAILKRLPKKPLLPLMLYNIPGRTGINMTVETMVELGKLDSIVAIKESSGDIDQITRLVASLDGSAVVYSGDDYLLLPILSVGGAGVVSVASHLVGKQIKRLIEAFQNGDHQEATQINQQLYPIFKGLFITSNPVPVKYALSKLGLCSPNVRPPLAEMSEQEKVATDEWLKKIEI